MKSNIAAVSMSPTGEIFSHGATSAIVEKIVKTPADAPVLLPTTKGSVTLISKSDHTCPAVEKMQDTGLEHDLQHLTKMELRRQYPAEANSHRNMLTRSKRRGNIVHPDLQEFRNFLRLVGPMPVSGATLDRIDNTDPEYAPGKVRWADKHTQNNNKGDTLTFHDQQTGEVFTASRLARLQGVDASTIRQRRARGWSDEAIIAGTRSVRIKNRLPSPSPRASEPRDEHETRPPVRSRPIRDSEFERLAAEFAEARKNGEEEPLIAPHYDINDGLPEGSRPVTEEEWLAFFKKHWPSYRPHLIFERASPYHQRAIEIIDPEYVKRERAKIARKEELKSLL